MTCSCSSARGINNESSADQEEQFEFVIPDGDVLDDIDVDDFLGFGKKKRTGKAGQARSSKRGRNKKRKSNPWKHGFEDMQSMEMEYNGAEGGLDEEVPEISFPNHVEQQLRIWAGRVKSTSSLKHIERENHRIMSLRYIRMGVIADRIERLVSHYARSSDSVSTGAGVYAGQYLAAGADIQTKQAQVERFMKESEKIGLAAWRYSVQPGGVRGMSEDAAIKKATANFRSDPILALVIAAPDQLADIDAVAKYKGMVEQIQRRWRQKYERFAGESYSRLEKTRR